MNHSEGGYGLDDSQSSVLRSVTEDIRSHLYGTLKDKGLIDNIKSQIRQRLITELAAKRGLPRAKSATPRLDGVDSDQLALVEKAANSLVADYLNRSRYEYTLSVFIPETGLSSDKIFSAQELLTLLQLSPESEFYKKVERVLKTSGKSFLWSFLRTVSEHYSKSHRENDAQTDRSYPALPLGERMEQIDREFATRKVKQNQEGQLLIEERMVCYQRETEKRLREEMDAELERFKERELNNIREQERDRLLKELDGKRKELETDYRIRLSGCSERERLCAEQLQRQTETQEREAYLRRQTLLDEVDALKEREAALRREQDHWNRERKLLQEKYKAMEEEVSRRERAVKSAELGFEGRLAQETNKVKLSEEARYIEKWKELEMMDARINEEARLVEAEKDVSRRLREQLLERQAQFDEMEVVDYSTIKQENITLKKEIEGLRERLAEVQQENDSVNHQLKKSQQVASKSVEAGHEVEELQEMLHKERQKWDQQRQAIEMKLEEESSQCKNAERKYEEQGAQLRDLSQEVEYLRHQLSEAEKALNMELYRRPHGYTPRTGRTNSSHPTGPLDSARSQPSRSAGFVSARTPRGFSGDHQQDEDALLWDGEGPSTCDDVVQETRWRLKNLDQETDALMQSYRNFQFRLLHPTSSQPGAPVWIHPRPTTAPYSGTGASSGYPPEPMTSQSGPGPFASDQHNAPYPGPGASSGYPEPMTSQPGPGLFASDQHSAPYPGPKASSVYPPEPMTSQPGPGPFASDQHNAAYPGPGASSGYPLEPMTSQPGPGPFASDQHNAPYPPLGAASVGYPPDPVASQTRQGFFRLDQHNAPYPPPAPGFIGAETGAEYESTTGVGIGFKMGNDAGGMSASAPPLTTEVTDGQRQWGMENAEIRSAGGREKTLFDIGYQGQQAAYPHVVVVHPEGSNDNSLPQWGSHQPKQSATTPSLTDSRRPQSPRHSTAVTFDLPLDSRPVRQSPLPGLAAVPEPITDGGTSRDLGSTVGHLGPTEAALSQPDTMLSLDDTWKSHGSTSNVQSSSEALQTTDGKGQSDADIDWEERRRQRLEEQRQREEHEWEKQQAELARLRGEAPPISSTNENAPSSQAPPTEGGEEEEDIDPVMKMYMEKVKAQKEAEAKSREASTTSEKQKKEEKFMLYDDEEEEAVISAADDEPEKSPDRSGSDSFW